MVFNVSAQSVSAERMENLLGGRKRRKKEQSWFALLDEPYCHVFSLKNSWIIPRIQFQDPSLRLGYKALTGFILLVLLVFSERQRRIPLSNLIGEMPRKAQD